MLIYVIVVREKLNGELKMKKRVVERGYAKINLHLDVSGILPDGYHAVTTVMQSISLYDEITVSDICHTEGASDFTVSCNVEGVPCDARNLAHKAAMLFCQRTGLSLSAHIDIRKNIPMAAGMAGGSTDGAAVLRGLNLAVGSPLSDEELCSLAAQLGADLPFCIVGGTRLADGRGDILHSFPKMPPCTLVVACEGEGVSTPWAYRLLDTTYKNFTEGAYTPMAIDKLRKAMADGSVRDTAGAIYNIFETPVLAERPVAANIKKILLSSGALGAMMSGSGPSVFGIFDSEEGARGAASALEVKGYRAYICVPV